MQGLKDKRKDKDKFRKTAATDERALRATSRDRETDNGAERQTQTMEQRDKSKDRANSRKDRETEQNNNNNNNKRQITNADQYIPLSRDSKH